MQPIEAKRALRPIRSPKVAWPTRRRLIAEIAGPSTQLASACRTRDAMTTRKIGHSASASALIPIAITASAVAQRSERTASTTAPPGIWPAKPMRLPTVRIRPMSPWVQVWVVR